MPIMSREHKYSHSFQHNECCLALNKSSIQATRELNYSVDASNRCKDVCICQRNPEEAESLQRADSFGRWIEKLTIEMSANAKL